MTSAPHGLDLEHAADAIPEWGFLAEPGAPEGRGPGYLFVALRDKPTLAHFDPELVRFWVSTEGRGAAPVRERRGYPCASPMSEAARLRSSGATMW